MNDIGKRAHVLNHSQGRCVVGASDKNLHEGFICNEHRSVLSFILHKSILLHFVHHGTIFYDKYITSDDKKKYIYDDESHIFIKQKVGNFYSAKYQKIYYNRYYIIKSWYMKDTRIRQTYWRGNRRETGFLYLKGLPYRDAEG